MTRIKTSEIRDQTPFISVLQKGIHKGFIQKSNLDSDEIEYCKKTPWIKKQVQFFCDSCQMNHKTSPDNVVCPSRQIRVQSADLTEGFQISPEVELPEPPRKEYNLEVIESRKYIDPEKVEKKTLYFTSDAGNLELYEPSGRIVVAPISRLPDAYSQDAYGCLIEEIQDLVKESIDWGKLDSAGDKFQKLTYQLLRLEDEFNNVSPGGTGPDQGKDGFCYKRIGRRKVKILVQVKFNNDGSGLNQSDINSMVINAEGLDCNGLLVTTIKTTGDLETKLGNPNFVSQMQYLDVWEDTKMKSKISKYPSLIERYFLT